MVEVNHTKKAREFYTTDLSGLGRSLTCADMDGINWQALPAEEDLGNVKDRAIVKLGTLRASIVHTKELWHDDSTGRPHVVERYEVAVLGKDGVIHVPQVTGEGDAAIVHKNKADVVDTLNRIRGLHMNRAATDTGVAR